MVVRSRERGAPRRRDRKEREGDAALGRARPLYAGGETRHWNNRATLNLSAAGEEGLDEPYPQSEGPPFISFPPRQRPLIDVEPLCEPLPGEAEFPAFRRDALAQAPRGQVADLRLGSVLFPREECEFADPDLARRVLLAEASFDPTLPQMLPKRPRFPRIRQRPQGLELQGSEWQEGNASMRVSRSEKLYSRAAMPSCPSRATAHRDAQIRSKLVQT